MFNKIQILTRSFVFLKNLQIYLVKSNEVIVNI